VLGPDGLSRSEELSRREAADAAVLYALLEHDGEDMRNHILDRKTALARLLRDTEPGMSRTALSSSPRLPVGRIGHHFEAGGQHISIRSMPGLDQGTNPAGVAAQRERSANWNG
jgi:hypothetical protein